MVVPFGGWWLLLRELSCSAEADKVLAGNAIHKLIAEFGVDSVALAGVGANGLPQKRADATEAFSSRGCMKQLCCRSVNAKRHDRGAFRLKGINRWKGVSHG